MPPSPFRSRAYPCILRSHAASISVNACGYMLRAPLLIHDLEILYVEKGAGTLPVFLEDGLDPVPDLDLLRVGLVDEMEHIVVSPIQDYGAVGVRDRPFRPRRGVHKAEAHDGIG